MYTLGIDIGGTKCAVILGKDAVSENAEDTIIAKKKFATNVERGWHAVVSELLSTAEEIL